MAQGTRVFIRNLMSSSLALDINLVDNTSGKKTHTGLLEEQAKHHQDQKSIAELVRISVETVKSISYLQECDVLMAVPAMLNKGFDLPRELAKGISTGIGKPNMTPNFLLEGKQGSAKAVDLSQKWDVWASCLFRYDGSSLARRRVMLVDDKYQSGVTMQFWAAELLKMGASEAHGLSMVKTLRDTDNQ